MTTDARNVRAWNVRVGDELPFFDTKKRKERAMVVVETSASCEGVVQLTIRNKGGRHRYVWQMRRTSLVRVRRGAK